VCSNAQSVLGHLPTEVRQADVMREIVVKFWEQAEWCLRLDTLGWRICGLILGSTDDRVHLAICLEEAAM
jgi:hypothetical protein